MAPPNGPWDLQEVITEQRTVKPTAASPLKLHLDKVTIPPSPQVLARSAASRVSRKLGSNGSGVVETPRPTTSYTLRIVLGKTVVRKIDVTKLLDCDHEIRLVPPTRATLLYSDPDQPGAKSSKAGRSHTDSEQNCFLKLCFQSLSDLKEASQIFIRIGLRCTTQFKTPSRSLSRTPMPTVTGGPSETQGQAQAQSQSQSANAGPRRESEPAGNQTVGPSYRPQPPARLSTKPPAQTTPVFARPDPVYRATVTHGSSKRNLTDIGSAREARSTPYKRQRSSIVPETQAPTQSQNGASTQDQATLVRPASQNTPDFRPANRPANRKLSRSLHRSMTRLSDRIDESEPLPPPVDMADSPMEAEEPPPRRELPQSISRHMSWTSSAADKADGVLSASRQPTPRGEGQGHQHEPAPAKQAPTTGTDAQTAKPRIDPEVAFFAGMELFQDLANLKDKMVKDCLEATRRLGEGGYEEEQARLLACYALEFKARFKELCSEKANIFLTDRSLNTMLGGTTV